MGDLKRRLLFLLGALVVFRIGSFIPVPGIDQTQLAELFGSQRGGILDMFNMFSGGALSRFSIFALGIMPYISASIIMQLMSVVSPTLEALKKEGESGRRKITQYTRYGTAGLALFQSLGIAIALESQRGLVIDPGIIFRLTAMVTLVTGTIFLMWLGEQITERGIGNGASLLIFFSIVERIWPGIFQTLNFVTTGALAPLKLVVLIVMMILVVAATVSITVAARRVQIQIPQRAMGRGRMREAARNFIPLRMNAANVMPIIFAQSLIVVPGTIAQFSGNPRLQAMAEYFNPGTPLYFLLSAVLILFFTYFYTSIIFNPIDIAENLKKQGGFIPGVKPGAKTAEYIDHVVSRITLPGAVFLTLVALLPIWIAGLFNVPFQFGGTSLLIVVGVGLDTVQKFQEALLLRKYDSFMKKGGRVRFRGRGAPAMGILLGVVLAGVASSLFV
jgi:preprotein translocase subunit SecY